MITNVTSFSRSGLSDWLLQRVTAVVMAAYTVFITAYLLFNSGLEYSQWLGLHSHIAMKIFNVLTVLSIAVHAWIGLWAVLTDYVTERLLGPKATVLRIFLQLGMITVTLVYVIWALDIVWGI
ncbi:MAG: succinate dehydrogenase, hydrophobic membrane anchor protein [Porticoccus sp.]|uniref:succinate dehydrogenase, hydrophobic membrane anchor protein n=1 Tax=Porticoccus sp. TaxID=2024853 RepID=UPI000C0CAD24|nr:succinate dehydrogenase, hydrophobic membrane anchor protein [Porticoccus sp.]MAZ69900.1 succinate dehydrogenase, hydrophobic membrane anchor protein [Porticoccus sp.]PHS76450.1 MAG: succinate dehydrogenase, hydrophobic membrane anchor protein [Porticoccus sp.]|tara:strand:- start:671 stop:1039 length:369 start_codon:yes stop_codon:yes gene_type:complete